MNEAKIISTPFLTPNARSALSFSDRAGRSTGVLGRLTPFREDRVPELRDLTRSEVPSMATTWRERIPDHQPHHKFTLTIVNEDCLAGSGDFGQVGLLIS